HPELAKFGESANLETLEVASAKLNEKQQAIHSAEKSISQFEWQLNEWAEIADVNLAEVEQTLAENIQQAKNLTAQIETLQAKVAQKETIQATLETLKINQNKAEIEKNNIAVQVENLHQQVQLAAGKLNYLEQSIPADLRDKAVFEHKKNELNTSIQTHIEQAERVDAAFRQAEKATTQLESTLASAQKAILSAQEALQEQRE
ncbi:TPA: SMC family ATPase, partial [Listeria monocytogenes]|nr:SMC family ATPase [Listeria monocytogenes]